MTLETINTYRSRKQEIYAEIDKMHECSKWTQEMEERQEKLENKYKFLSMRIEEIEEMISYNDDYYYAYLSTQH
jgi:archaellum component FlaC